MLDKINTCAVCMCEGKGSCNFICNDKIMSMQQSEITLGCLHVYRDKIIRNERLIITLNLKIMTAGRVLSPMTRHSLHVQ